MKTNATTALKIILLALLAVPVLCDAGQEQARVVQTVEGDDWAMPAWVKMTPNAGLISWACADGGHGEWLNRKAGDPRYNDGEVHLAGICYVKWADVNPAEDVYDWSSVDENMAKYVSKPGVGFTLWLANYSKDVLPAWLLKKPGMYVLPDGTLPAWRTDCPYQACLKKLIRALAERYKDNPKFLALEMRGLDKDWGELYYHGKLEDAKANHGFTPESFKRWCFQYIDDCAEAFPGQERKLVWLRQGGPHTPNYFHNTLNPEYEQASIDVTNYAYKKGCGRRDGGVEIWTWYTWNAELYGQRVTPEGYLEVIEDFPPLRDGRMWYTENEILQKCPYLWPDSESDRVWPILSLRTLQFRCNWVWINSNFYDGYDQRHPGFNRWFELSLGKTAKTSPDAWSWLREGYVWGYDGKWDLHTIKNFERWVFQRDVKGDGATCPDDWLDVTKWGQWIKEWYFGKKGGEYLARRTDLAHGGSKIYFRTYPEFIANGPHRVLIKVTYRDGPATSWRIEYKGAKAAADSESCATANSGAWKTVTFEVPDMCFEGTFPGGMDFRIANLGPHDLTVKFLRIIKLHPVAGPEGGAGKAAVKSDDAANPLSKNPKE